MVVLVREPPAHGHGEAGDHHRDEHVGTAPARRATAIAISGTPISSAPAHDVSVIPITRPRREYGTRSEIHELSPTSNTSFARLRRSRATANIAGPVDEAAANDATVTPESPTVIAPRRDMRSM